MENQDKLNKPIGTKEIPKLEAKEVEVQGLRLDPKTKKDSDKIVGELLVLICKHPDREELIEFTKVKILKGENLKVLGLWYGEDEDKNIQKGSAIAELMSFVGVDSLGELTGKKVQTVEQSKDVTYLCVKAY
ncbi:hypothetical protein LCGC14_1544130 [marine sediment metagenome]|uniref:Uncharacterized protein n=1 Tax=marine sediment metagenome TaxID=412755 RepID=A0A0F9JD35_9ZZZZ